MSMPVPRFSSSGKEKLDALLADTTAQGHLPAIFWGAANADGPIYYNQAGQKVTGDPSKGNVDEHTDEICHLSMQLVEAGLVSLDSEADIERILPEVGKLPLLQGYDGDKAILVQPAKKVTLRMLMSHSAGMVYPHAPSLLSKYIEQNPVPNHLGPQGSLASISVPLIYEPGTSWTYSVSIDWVGVVVERLSGLNLEDYFQKNLFAPAGVTTMTFYPTDEVKRHKMHVHTRDASGNIVPIPGGWGLNRATDLENVKRTLLCGGGGLFGTQKDYLLFLSHMLKCDPRYATPPAKPLLSPASYAELFRPSIPMGDGYDGLDKIVAMVSRPKYIGSDVNPNTIKHSVGCLINTVDWPGRRKAYSGCWSGMAKTQFWIDPASGIAGVCGTQLVSPAPDPWFASYVAFEEGVYAALQ